MRKRSIKLNRRASNQIDNHEYALMYFNLNFKFASIDNTIYGEKKTTHIRQHEQN